MTATVAFPAKSAEMQEDLPGRQERLLPKLHVFTFDGVYPSGPSSSRWGMKAYRLTATTTGGHGPLLPY